MLQHGETPLAGVTPVVRIRDGGGKVVESVHRDTDREGRASTTPTSRFPAEGTYSYEVYDGFTEYGGAQTHTFKPVAIGPRGGGFPYRAARGSRVGLALALAGATILAAAPPQPAPQPIQLKEAA